MCLAPSLPYSDRHSVAADEWCSSCGLLGLQRIKVKVCFHNSRCLRKVINNSVAVAVYRLRTQGQSISQTQVRNIIHILYKGELTTQPIGNIFLLCAQRLGTKAVLIMLRVAQLCAPVCGSNAVCCRGQEGRVGSGCSEATTGDTSMRSYAVTTMSW